MNSKFSVFGWHPHVIDDGDLVHAVANGGVPLERREVQQVPQDEGAAGEVERDLQDGQQQTRGSCHALLV